MNKREIKLTFPSGMAFIAIPLAIIMLLTILMCRLVFIPIVYFLTILLASTKWVANRIARATRMLLTRTDARRAQ